jgi:hypothetical protein
MAEALLAIYRLENSAYPMNDLSPYACDAKAARYLLLVLSPNCAEDVNRIVAQDLHQSLTRR